MNHHDYDRIQEIHMGNVNAIIRAVDALFELLEHDGDPPRQDVLRIAQDLVRDMKIKWQDEDEPATGMRSPF